MWTRRCCSVETSVAMWNIPQESQAVQVIGQMGDERYIVRAKAHCLM